MSIFPEGLGIYRSPRLPLHMANKIFPSDEEILKKYGETFFLLSQLPLIRKGKRKTLQLFLGKQSVLP